MGLLAKGSKGIQKFPPIIGIYGEGGLGKTTFATGAPKPYVIEVNGGSGNLDVHRSDRIKTYDQGVAQVQALIDEAHDFQTVIIDGLDDMETMLQKKVCDENVPKVKTIVEAAKGYGNGYKIMNEEFVKLQGKLVELREKKNTQIIFTLHPLVVRFNDPTTPEGYDRFCMKLIENNQAPIRRSWFDFADIILFAKRKVLAVSSEGKMRRAMDAAVDGLHVIYTQGRATFDAKNRYGLPFEIPLHWSDFDAAMNAKPKTSKELKAEIKALTKEVVDSEVVEKIEAGVKETDDVNDLGNIRDRILEILAGQAPSA